MKLVGEEVQQAAPASSGSSGSTGGSSEVGSSSYSEESSSVLQPEYETLADERAKEKEQERIKELFGLNEDEETETFVEEEQDVLELEEQEEQEKARKEAEAKEKEAEAEAKAAAEKAKSEADKKAAEEKAKAEKAAQAEAERRASEAKAETKREAEQYKNERGYDDNIELSAREAITRMGNSSIYEGKNDVMGYFNTMACAAEDLTHNDQWKISMDSDGDGTLEDVNLADAIADSFDSELDLYIQEEVNKIIDKYGTCSKGYLSDEALTELAMKGIRVDAVGGEDQMTNRAYCFSLIDVPDDIRELMNKDNLTAEEQQKIKDAVYADDAKVMEDKNGKKGSYIFADCLIPDGYAQGAEVNLSSILDQMGYDCISKADFIGHEDEYWEVINAVKEGIKNGEYGSSVGMKDIYGNLKEIRESVTNLWGGNGSAPGQHVYGLEGGDGSGLSAAEKAEKAAAEKAEQEKADKEIKAYKEKLMNEKIQEYKKENNNEEPSKSVLYDFEKEVDIKVKAKFGSKVANK